MDDKQFILALVQALASIAWPAAFVIIAYIVKCVLDKTEIKDPDDKDADPSISIKPPRVQVRPAPSPRSNEAPPGR